jgi:hypothetical protein
MPRADEQVIRPVQREAELQARMDVEARATAAVNRHVDSHSRIATALVAALKAAREQGQIDAAGALWPAFPSPLMALSGLEACR